MLVNHHRDVRDLLRRIALLLSEERPLAAILREVGKHLGERFEASVRIEYFGPEGEPLVYASSSAETPIHREVRFPIAFSGTRHGELALAPDRALDPDDVALLETCAVYLGARLHDERNRRVAERLEHLALTDALTGVANRRAFDRTLDREWSRARRTGSPISLVMIDIDRFKAYNDAYGHAAGDRCLRAASAAAAACLRRPGDFFGRYGGEEFVALLPETNVEGAVMVAEAMRAAVERLAIAHNGAPFGRITISAGAAHVLPKDSTSGTELIGAADAALYAAKAEGRNRVMSAHALALPADVRTVAGNLPSRPTRFVGHAGEVTRLTAVLEATPITSIVGPAGVGKTRIAIEVARRIGAFFPDGTWFLDLAMLDDPNDFIPFACEILRSVAPLARDESSLIDGLSDKRLLLLLDNCEHVLPPAAHFAALLAAAGTELRILITSREPLPVKGSAIHRLAPLALEDAVELFEERARGAGIWSDDARRATVAAIVQQLDAIPFAIELVAPALRDMAPEELLHRLDDRLSVLAIASQSPGRQQTLQALLDWSNRLLDADSAKLFRRLAVFAGGCTLEAAMHVCADERELNEAQVADALADLVAKSMVLEESTTAGARFRMLEITRIYAQTQLAESGEFDAAAYAHVRFFGTLAKRFESTLETVPVARWRTLVGLEGQNFRTALSVAIDVGDVESVAAICEGLHYWLWENGAVAMSDMARRIAAMLTMSLKPSVEAPLRLAMAALIRREDRRRAHELAERSFHLYRALGDDVHAGDALRSTVTMQYETRGAPDPSLESEMLRYIERMLDLGETLRAADLLNNLGVCYAELMDDSRLPDALRCFERAAGLFEARGDTDRCGRVVGNSAGIAFLLGDADMAARRSQRAVEMLERSDVSWLGGRQWANHGYYLLACGRNDEARDALLRGIAKLRDLGDRVGLAGALQYMAQLYHRSGDDHLAARLIGFADATFGTGATRQAREAAMLAELLDSVRARLGAETFDVETRRGAGSTIEEIVRVAESA